MKPLWTEVSPIQVDVMGVPAGVPSAAPSKFIGGGVTTNGSAIAAGIWLGIRGRGAGIGEEAGGGGGVGGGGGGGGWGGG
ncbi:hypothetical protein, partial [Proteus mirabilis]|uniref:hypothetical protein n=1 Tax=Proteus mirabilis TaxID=584 RepID=UPI001FD86839